MIAAVRVEYQIDTALREEGKIDLTDEQSTQLRGSIAGLSWAARQSRPDFVMTLWSFKESELRRLCIQDSAFDPHGRQRAQHGWMIFWSQQCAFKLSFVAR